MKIAYTTTRPSSTSVSDEAVQPHLPTTEVKRDERETERKRNPFLPSLGRKKGVEEEGNLFVLNCG